MSGQLLARRGVLSQQGGGDAMHPFVSAILAMPDLAAYWRMNDPDDVLRDAAGLIADGVYRDLGTPSVLGPALLPGDPTAASRDFEASSQQWAQPPGGIDLRAASVPGWTFGCLCRVESGGPSGDTTVMWSDTYGSGPNNGLFVGMVAGTRQPRNGGWGSVYDSPTALPLGTDLLLGFTQVSATGLSRVFIDGVEDGAGAVTNLLTSLPTQMALATWDQAGEKLFDGLMAECFVVKRALTPAEWADLQDLRA